MLGNWSVMLNILLLAGVMVAIGRMIKSKRESRYSTYSQPLVGQPHEDAQYDDIIAVRKINRNTPLDAPTISPTISPVSTSSPTPTSTPTPIPASEVNVSRPKVRTTEINSSSVMMFLLAKDNRQLGGYELLQTLLSVGLRFGEGHLFHRHQHANGQGPVLCSVAAATSTGMFDLQNIGAFSVLGLCIFMEASGSAVIDEERFSIMLNTARQLSEDLDTYLLDDNRQPLNQAGLKRYYHQLNLGFVNDMALVE